MECKKCGAPTVEGATYCGICGARVDGKKECFSCGKLVDESFTFCIYCGTRIDGKTACPSCGMVHEGSFCPSCGSASEPVKLKNSPSRRVKKENNAKFGAISSVISNASMMFGVLISLIFVFLIGFVMQGQMDGQSKEETENLYYFFGDVYDELEDLNLFGAGMNKWFENLIEEQSLLYAVIGTVIAALTILSVVTFAAVAITKYVRGWVKKEETKITGWALATILSFLVGSAMLLAHDRLTGKMEVQGQTMKVFMKFNGATTTAIIACGFAVVSAVIFRLLAKKREFWTAQNITKIVMSFVGVAFACVVLALAKNASFAATMEMDEIGMEGKFQAGYIASNIMGASFWGSIISPEMENYYEITKKLTQMSVYNIISLALAVALIVFAALSLAVNVRGLTGEKKSGLIWSILAAGTSVALLVFTILSLVCGEDMLVLLAKEASETLPKDAFLGSFAVPICGVVFSMLMLAVSIVRTVYVRKQQTIK